jgi:hypothetical protein
MAESLKDVGKHRGTWSNGRVATKEIEPDITQADIVQ